MNFRTWLEATQITKDTDGRSVFFHAVDNDQEIGIAQIYQDKMLKSAAVRFFPSIVKPDDTVWRLQQIGIYDEFRQQYLKTGVGKLLWTEIFQHIGNDFLANSQLGFPDTGDYDAATSLQSFAKHGYIELHWHGGPGRFFIARKTQAGVKEFYVRGYWVYDYLKLGSKSYTAQFPEQIIDQAFEESPPFIPLRITSKEEKYSIPDPMPDEIWNTLEKLPRSYGTNKSTMLQQVLFLIKQNMKKI